MLQPGVEYSEVQLFRRSDLQNLFLSIDWESGRFPEKLQSALEHSDRVISAWESGKLIGLMNAISDGAMVVYFHYLIVHPEYQRKGIGTHLMRSMLTAYANIRQKVLIAYDQQIAFYERFGFKKSTNATSMHINEF